MREILFKAKREDNGKWIEGTLVQTTAVSLKSFIVESSCYTFDKWDWLNLVEVDNETLCQCTGMTDKNCIEIYEHDVVKFFGMVGEIVFEAGAFGIVTRNTIDWETINKNIDTSNSPNFTYNDNYVSLWEIFWNFDEEDCIEIEVIGNKFDNPELLEEK